MNWRKLFIITYWLRGKEKSNFNALTFLLDVYIHLGLLLSIILFI